MAPVKNSDGRVHFPLMRNETVTSAVVLACSSPAVVVLKIVMQFWLAAEVLLGNIVVIGAVVETIGTFVDPAPRSLVDPLTEVVDGALVVATTVLLPLSGAATMAVSFLGVQ